MSTIGKIYRSTLELMVSTVHRPSISVFIAANAATQYVIENTCTTKNKNSALAEMDAEC